MVMARVRGGGHQEIFEDDHATMHPLISWRSVVAGLLIAFFSMIGLLGLGMAMGGIGLNEDTSAKGAGIFTGVWFLASTLISIFVGSYFAARVSKFQTGRIGSAQGLVIAALFLGFFLYQSVSAIVGMGGAAGSMIGKSAVAIGTGASRVAQRPGVMATIGRYAEDALGDLNLRSEPTVVARGVADRVVHGDSEGAKNYLARQAGITPEEADARIAQLKTRADRVIDEAKVATGNALQATGWSLFLLVILGALSSVLGGALGSVANFRNPLSREQFVARQHSPA